MSDEQMQPLLEVWLRNREIPRPKVQTGVANVMASVPRTRQHGRRWPLRAPRRTPGKPTATDTAEYQLTHFPIAATNGHVPIIFGRTHTMFSPVKAITVGALVFAVGGLFLISQPLDQQGSVPAAMTDALGHAAYVHGTGAGFQCCGDEVETYDEDDNRLTLRDMVASYMLTMDDPRLSGTVESTTSIDEFPQPGADERVEVSWSEMTITNDEGAWKGICRGTYNASQFPEEVGIGICELTGTEAYEGLSAFLWGEGNEFNGAIFPGPLPPESAYAE